MTDFFKKQMIPILLSTTIVVAILNTFTTQIGVYILPVLLFVTLVFFFCDFVKSQKNRAQIYYLLGFAIIAFLIRALIVYGASDISFANWVLSVSLESGHTSYFFALFILSGFFISSSVFYFTNIIYRSAFLFLIILIPCVLFIKKLSRVPSVYLLLFITLYFMTMIFFGNNELKNSVKHMTKTSYKKAIGIFVSILFLLTLGTSYIKTPDRLADSKLSIDRNSQITNLLGYNSSSGAADSTQNLDQILFLVEADEQIYFILQVFGQYDGKQWNAIKDKKMQSGFYDWEKRSENTNFDKLFEDIRYVSDELSDTALANMGINDIDNLMYSEEAKTAKIIPQGIASRYILAPTRTFSVAGVPNGIEYIRDLVDEIFINGYDTVDKEYTISYYSEIFRRNEDFQNYAAQFSGDEFVSLLTNLFPTSSLRNKGLNHVGSYFASEWANAQRYAQYSEGYISEEIRSLAEEITAGKIGDYEKAQALERYFHENNYTYDINYRPPNGKEDIEYFIFESKTGSCGHYATAMTLMARSIGLNTRYVEGFTSYEKNDEGQYVFRAKNSHAFPQIFIPVYGWVTFEPTVASTDTNPFGSAQKIFSKLIGNNTPIIFTALTGIILLGTLSYFVFAFFIAEKIFRLKIAKSNGRDSIILIYGKVLKLAYRKLGIFNITATALAQTIKDKYDSDIQAITECFDRVAFNGEDITKKEKQAAQNAYVKFYSSCR